MTVFFEDYNTDHLFDKYRPIGFPCVCKDYDHIIWGIYNLDEDDYHESFYITGQVWLGDPKMSFFQRLFSKKGLKKFTFDCIQDQETYGAFKYAADLFGFSSSEVREDIHGKDVFHGWTFEGTLPEDFSKLTWLDKLVWVLQGSTQRMITIGYYSDDGSTIYSLR